MFGYNKFAMINGFWFFMSSVEIAGPLNGGTTPYIPYRTRFWGHIPLLSSGTVRARFQSLLRLLEMQVVTGWSIKTSHKYFSLLVLLDPLQLLLYGQSPQRAGEIGCHFNFGFKVLGNCCLRAKHKPSRHCQDSTFLLFEFHKHPCQKQSSQGRRVIEIFGDSSWP